MHLYFSNVLQQQVIQNNVITRGMKQGIGYNDVWLALYGMVSRITNRDILISTSFAPSLCTTYTCYTCKDIHVPHLFRQIDRQTDVSMYLPQQHAKTYYMWFFKAIHTKQVEKASQDYTTELLLLNLANSFECQKLTVQYLDRIIEQSCMTLHSLVKSLL